MENIFDTHAHYDDEAFDIDRETLLSTFENRGVSYVIDCGCDVMSSKKAIELSEKYDFIYAAVGIHPHEADDADDSDIDIIKRLTEHEKVVAIGEIGLDYHYDFSPRELQKEYFEKQIILANELDIPIIVHDREAHEDTMQLLRKYKPKGVLHCFSGSVETAKEIISLGMYIGLGGAVTFKNAKKPVEVAEYLPLDRFLLETDAPYMTPVPFRGKRNDSTLIPYAALKIAEIKGIDAQVVVDAACENAKRLFGIK